MHFHQVVNRVFPFPLIVIQLIHWLLFLLLWTLDPFLEILTCLEICSGTWCVLHIESLSLITSALTVTTIWLFTIVVTTRQAQYLPDNNHIEKCYPWSIVEKIPILSLKIQLRFHHFHILVNITKLDNISPNSDGPWLPSNRSHRICTASFHLSVFQFLES